MKGTWKHTGALLSLAFALASTSLYSQTLDASFGTGGKVNTDFAGGSDGASAIAVQPDGRLVAAGSAFINDVGNFALARYNSNGTLDTSFGAGGRATTNFGGRFDHPTSVALQADGKIVVAGGSSAGGQFNDFAVARFNSNGTLDTSFGTGGKVLTEFGVSAQATSVAVQQDGKIVVSGYANIDGGNNFEVVRYNSNGTLDTSFGTGGQVTTTFGLLEQGFSYAQANSLALQQDGKIVLTGNAFFGGAYNFALARYNSNGTLDTSFGTGGKVTTTFPTPNTSSNVSAFSVVVQPDGKLVAAGLAAFDIALARYTSSGALDTTFGNGGRVITSVSPSYDGLFSVALQPDGKIVAAGRTFVLNDDFHSTLLRYNSNGTLDTTFGAAGKLINLFGVQSEGVSAVAVQQDGKIVAAGGATITGNSDFALARFNSDSGSSTSTGTHAGFVQLDTTTGGSWKGVYGQDGYIVIGEGAHAPSYGNATVSNNSFYVWSDPTAETRAVQKAFSASDRIAACWYSGAFTIDLNFTDANLHQVALYMLDWDSWGGGRTQRVEVFDANNQLIDTRLVSGFTGGQYIVWNLSGHVTIRLTSTNPNSNAVVSGLFFR